MSEKIEKDEETQQQIMDFLSTCYEKCKNGIPKISMDVESLAGDYIKKYPTTEKACKAMLRNQVIKCTTSGVITGFGGIVTIPVALPANVGSVLYMQMRMIACTAHMAGFELDCDQTQTFVFACLAGVSINSVIKTAGIKIGVKAAENAVKRIPGKVLVKINQKVGFRLATKFGSKGVINIGKLVPVVGAVIGGGFDCAETSIIANRAYKWFFEGDYDVENNDDLDVIDMQ